MAYSINHLRTAGKITVFTTIVGIFAFAVVFLSNLGATHNTQVAAQQQATTSVEVLNTPPTWTVAAEEEFESSTSSPTDEGLVVSWVGTGTDANAEPYFLLICSGTSTPAPPIPNISAAPDCAPGQIQWGVSTATVSGTEARVATTTTASSSPFNGEVFGWYAWICDDNPSTPRCNSTYETGSGNTASPFHVNHRPQFTIFTDTSPTAPGAVVTFYSTSTDDDITGGQDTIRLIVCDSVGFSTSTDSCTGTLLGSTTAPGPTDDASATYTVVIPTQDQNYQAIGYVIDEHGLEASGGAHGTDSTLTVANVAPTTSPSTIVINAGTDLILTNAATQTPGFTLQFTAADNNSCDAVGGGLGDEIVDYQLSIYRSGVGSTTCSTDAADYDPNNCYPSTLPTSVWNLSCTASSTSCTGNTDVDLVYDCTFPLWYIADPTDGTATSTEYSTENWVAQVQAIDDDVATGTLNEAQTGQELQSLLAFTLNTLTIPYGALAPGARTDPLVATTTLAATGNVGMDTTLAGSSMCTSYTGSVISDLCQGPDDETIPDNRQVYATSTVTYGTASTSGNILSSTTAQELEINVPKSTATSTQATNDAYWGIEIPSSVTVAGDYFGRNEFIAIQGEAVDW